ECGGEARVRRNIGEEEDVTVVGRTELTVEAGAGDDLDAVLENVVVARSAEIEDAVRTRIVGGRVGGRIVGGLINDQVRNGARRGVHHQAAGLRIGGSHLRRAE